MISSFLLVISIVLTGCNNATREMKENNSTEIDENINKQETIEIEENKISEENNDTNIITFGEIPEIKETHSTINCILKIKTENGLQNTETYDLILTDNNKLSYAAETTEYSVVGYSALSYNKQLQVDELLKDTFDEYKAKTNEVNENNDLYKGTYVKQTLNQDSHTLTYITFRTLNDLRADVLKDFLNGKIGNYTDSNFIFRTQEFIDSMNSEGAVCTYK